MDNKTKQSVREQKSVKRHPKWEALRSYPHGVEDYYHRNQGPWPQPAPDNPVQQMAQVIHLPEEEKEDWKKNVNNMYRRRVLTCWPFGLWYVFKHRRYKTLDDNEFKVEITEGLYSKFMTDLDVGDLALFKELRPDLDLKDNESDYFKADFSCMEPIAPNCLPNMYAAPTITLIEKNKLEDDSFDYNPIAIYLYKVNESEDEKGKFSYSVNEKNVFTKEDGENWHLAKYFVIQGAVHRVNLTEHALLHFPFDAINAITKSILPTSHLLFQLLIPHFRLSLGVNRAVLENPGSLISRDKRKFYSPFCCEGIHVRKLLPDGYVGRDKKPKAYPPYDFPLEPKIPDSDFGKHLKAYYDVFAEFVPKVLEQIDDDDEESWLYIYLWYESIAEWMPGFETRKQFTGTEDINVFKPKTEGREYLNKIVTMIMWDLSVAHATDHIAIHNKRPHGNPFRLRVPPPNIDSHPAKNWRDNLVTWKDLLTFWFTDLLFYLPANVTTLEKTIYPFSIPGKDLDPEKKTKEQVLIDENTEFLKALKECEQNLKKDKVDIPAELKQISASLQY